MKRTALLLLILLSATLSAQQPIRVTGTLAAENASVDIQNVSSYGQVAIDIAGTYSGSLLFEGRGGDSLVGPWVGMPCFIPSQLPPNSDSETMTVAVANGHYLCSPSGFQSVRVRMESYVSGSASIVMRALGSASSVAALPNQLSVNVVSRIPSYLVTSSGSTLAVKNADPAPSDLALVVRNIPSGTQPVSAAALPLPAGAATAASQATGNTSLGNIDTKLTSASAAPLGTETAIQTRDVPFVRRSSTVTNFGSPIGTITLDGRGAAWAIADFDTTNLYNGQVWFTAYTDTTTSGSGQTLAPIFNLRALYTLNGNMGGPANGQWNFGGESYTNPLLAVPLPPGVTTVMLTQSAYTSGTAKVTLYVTDRVQDLTSLALGSASKTTPEYGLVVGGYDVSTALMAMIRLNAGKLLVDGSQATQPVSGTVTANAGTGTFAVSAASLPLPSGAATAANQATEISSLSSIDTKTPALVSGRVPVDGSGVTQPVSGTVSVSGGVAVTGPLTDVQIRATPLPVSGTVTANAGSGTMAVSASSLPLPTGASTSANQTTANTSLSNIETKTPALGQATMANSQPVVIASNQSAVPVSGTFWQATQPVSGTFWQATQPVSGTFWQATQPVSSTQLPAALAANGGLKIEGVASGVAVPVSGTFWQATQPVSLASVPTHAVTQSSGPWTTNQTQLNSVGIAVQQGVSDTGTQRVTMSQEATYAAATAAKTATAAGTAAFFELCGSASKTIRIQRISVSGTVATTAIYGDVQFRKNSSALTGGTATTLTNTPYDSNSAAATATAKFFTVLPSGGGALVGNIFAQTLFFPVTGTVTNFQPQLIYMWRDQDAEAPTLRGTAQCLAVGFGTTPTNAPTLSVSIAWTEK